MPDRWEDRLRAGLHTAVDGWTPHPVRRQPARPGRVRALAVAASLLLVAGVATAVVVRGHASPRPATIVPAPAAPAAPSTATALPVCGPAPAATMRPDIDATLVVSGEPTSGGTVSVTVELRPATAASIAIETGQPADVLILQDGQVVGRYEGAVGGTGYAGQHVTRDAPMRLPPTSVLLSGCPTGTLGDGLDAAHPDASRHPLPPGDYQLVATADGGIVTSPAPLTIPGAAPSPAGVPSAGACPTVPVDAHPEIETRLVVAATGVSGQAVQASVELRPTGTGAVQLRTGPQAQLYVVRDGAVIGGAFDEELSAKLGTATSDRPFVLPAAGPLVLGCSASGTGQPIPVGDYMLVGAVDGSYVSAAVPFTITAAPPASTVLTAPSGPPGAPTDCGLDQVSVSLRTDRAGYLPGQPVTVTRTVANHGTTACPLDLPAVGVLDGSGKPVWTSICRDASGHVPGSFVPACPSPGPQTIAAGDTVDDTQRWDQTVDGTATHGVRRAPAGGYRVVAGGASGGAFTVLPVPAPSLSASPSAPPPPTCADADLGVSWAVTGAPFTPGRLVHVARTVTNHGAAGCTWTRPTFGVVLDGATKPTWTSACGTSTGHPAELHLSCVAAPATVIPAGGSHTDTQDWDQTVDGTATHGVQEAPQGEYHPTADGVAWGGGLFTEARACGAGDIGVVISSDAPSYDPGSPVQITATVSNLSTTECQWRRGNLFVTITVDGADGTQLWDACGGPDGRPAGKQCAYSTEAESARAIEPGQPLTDTRTWAQQGDATESAPAQQVPAGTYTLRAVTVGGQPWSGTTTITIH